MTTVRPTAGRRQRSALQLVGGLLAALAVFGSVVLFFTDDARLLRLGLVALLWVAVGALVAVVRFRKESEVAQGRTREQRVVYELELEREVRARREHELHTELAVREQVGAQVREQGRLELDAVRDELKVLRESLSVLLSGDVLVERVALRAESTRIRSLTDTARVEAAAAPGQLVGSFPIEAETVEPEPVVSEPVPSAPVPSEPEPSAPVVETRAGAVEPEPVTEPVPVVAPVEAGVDAPPVGAERSGGHRRPDASQPEPEPESEPEEPGAHSNGRSVSDLLAAYGGATEGRRRRRTED